MGFFLNRRITVGLGLALLILSAITIFAYQSTSRLIETSRQVDYTVKLLEELEELLSLVKDVETGYRGYVITGETVFLEPYDQALTKIDKELAEISDRKELDQIQKDRINRLTELVQLRLKFGREVVATRKEQGFEAARRIVSQRKGKILMDQIRSLLGELKEYEVTRLTNQSQQADAYARRTVSIIGLGGILAISLTIVTFFLINQESRARRQIEANLLRTKDELEQRVKERTAELSQTNHHLQAEIEERRRVEASLAEERAQLSQRVAERTTELSLANAELARSSRLKDEFLASMSHELRTPLNAILGISEALQEEVFGPLNEKQQRSLGNIAESGRHLLALINDILDLSKIGAGKLELELAPVSIEQICQASLSLIREATQKKKLIVSTSIDSSITTITADARRLKQILVNLLSNAVKFTATGGRIGLEVVAAEQGIAFTVWDTGVGIAEKDMSRLFQPFVQLDSSLSRQHNGTGLGLALVYRMTELQGGSVSIESQLGVGSRFTVLFPHHLSAPPATTDSAIAPLPAPTAQLVIKRVLIIEDSPTAASQLVRYFDELKIESAIHSSEAGSFEKVLQYQPDLIVLDLLLPEPDGWDILAKLKSNPATRSIPVMIISVMDERTRGLADGATDFLVKPISREQLQTSLQQLLAQQPSKFLEKARSIVKSPMDNDDSRKLILLAEDNEMNITTVADYLQAKGFNLVIARNGVEALAQLRQRRPELVLMDIQMPVMDGLTAITQIRNDIEFASTPIIALTALAMPGDRERCLAAGANDYLSKPINLKGLLNAIEGQLSRL